MMVRALAAGLVATMVSGCLPIPNVHYFAPEVSGVVMQDGHPVGNAEVRVAGRFGSASQSGLASKDGRFSVKPIREFRFAAVLVGDPLYSYTVQLVVDGKTYDGYDEFGMGDAPKVLNLVCDLGHAIALGNRTGLLRHGERSSVARSRADSRVLRSSVWRRSAAP